MTFLLFLILALVLTAGIIWMLHRSQMKNQHYIAERSAPLPELDESRMAEFQPVPEPAATDESVDESTDKGTDEKAEDRPAENSDRASDEVSRSAEELATAVPVANHPSASVDNWQEQVKHLREEQRLDTALALCRDNYPRVQALQQTAIILRQQIREHIDQHKAVNHLLEELYRTAVLADLFRSASSSKPRNPQAALQGVLQHEVSYRQTGYRHLRLLTKSDVKHLEQLWGSPDRHQHAEDALGSFWQEFCT